MKRYKKSITAEDSLFNEDESWKDGFFSNQFSDASLMFGDVVPKILVNLKDEAFELNSLLGPIDELQGNQIEKNKYMDKRKKVENALKNVQKALDDLKDWEGK